MLKCRDEARCGRSDLSIVARASPAKNCYDTDMSNSAIRPERASTVMMPVMTMEEVPVLSQAERAEMLASLQEAQARIAAGQYTVYDPNTFKDRLVAIYRAAKNSASA
jgi:hypothetical protein